jgi:hypothetical protein
MRTRTWGSWGLIGIVFCAACGSSAHAPPPSETETAGHEEPAPPPPPPPASIRIVHASADPGLGTLSISLDGAAPIVTDLAAGTASAPIDVASGTHALRVLGVASVETGEAPEVLATSIELVRDTHPIVLVYGEPTVEPPLTVTVLEEDASGAATRARIVHGLIGVAGIDVCVAGAALAPALGAGAVSTVTPVAEGAVVVEIRATSATPCRGRAMGSAHVTLAASTAYVIALSGSLGRRGVLAGSLVVCSEGATGSCESAAIGRR